jgi:U3 small nucleolar ribonucleoprotein protein LCP5
MNQDSGEAGGSDHDDDGAERDGIYHPPKLAPVPYNEPTKDKSKRRALVPGGLSGLAHLDPSNPHVESSTGLGSTPSLSSKRARELARMNDFEEENMTRLVMNKKERNKRKRDEEMIALGGAGGGSGRGDGLAEEFADVFRGIGKKSRNGDGYEELRAKGKRQGAFERSKMRQSDMDFGEEDGPRPQRKKGKFDKGIRRR